LLIWLDLTVFKKTGYEVKLTKPAKSTIINNNSGSSIISDINKNIINDREIGNNKTDAPFDFSQNFFMKNFPIKKTTPPNTKKEQTQEQTQEKTQQKTQELTPLMEEFFKKRILILNQFEKRNRWFEKKIALNKSPFPDVALSDSNQRKTLQEAKEPNQDKKNELNRNKSYSFLNGIYVGFD
jgi:hypothetical protein